MVAAPRRRFRLFAALAATAVVLVAVASAGCLRRGDEAQRVIRVAVQAPATGVRAELGYAVRTGVELAVEDRREIFRHLGYRLEVVDFDEADPRQGVANAHLIAADPAVAGVVGHLSSDVAIPASERYHQDGLAVITVAATAPEFTGRGLDNVYRLVPRDDAQGVAAARFVARVLKAGAVFVVHDRSVYGQGLADAFKAEAERLGVRSAGYRGVKSGDDPDVIRSVSMAEAELVYFGGDEAEAARLLRGLRRIGVKVAFLAGDSLDSPAFGRLAGDAAAGVYYTAVGGRPDGTPRARVWVERYQARFAARPLPLAALGYDAAILLLDACARVAAAQPVVPLDRSKVAADLRVAGEYEGVSGPIRFDDRGDNALTGPGGIRVMRLSDKGLIPLIERGN